MREERIEYISLSYSEADRFRLNFLIPVAPSSS